MYCVQDRQLICGLCLTVGRHRGHAIDDLQAAFERERQTPALLLAELSDSRWSQVLVLFRSRLGNLLRTVQHCVYTGVPDI